MLSLEFFLHSDFYVVELELSFIVGLFVIQCILTLKIGAEKSPKIITKIVDLNYRCNSSNTNK